MKQITFGAFCVLLFSNLYVFAQVPSPIHVPVTETEIRDNSSIRMRSIEFERVKRSANSPGLREIDREPTAKFEEIKNDFENIQKLQISIVKAYTKGKKINYEKISESAGEIAKKAVRLDINLFASSSEKEANKNEHRENIEPKSVRNLIIELDDAIGIFISGQIFKNMKTVDPEISAKAHVDLGNIIKLSDSLSRVAKKIQ